MSAAEIARHIKVANSSIKRVIEEMVEGRGRRKAIGEVEKQ